MYEICVPLMPHLNLHAFSSPLPLLIRSAHLKQVQVGTEWHKTSYVLWY